MTKWKKNQIHKNVVATERLYHFYLRTQIIESVLFYNGRQLNFSGCELKRKKNKQRQKEAIIIYKYNRRTFLISNRIEKKNVINYTRTAQSRIYYTRN